MSKKGQIKRQDIISDETINWGDQYAKTIKKAIKANKKFIKSMAEIQKFQNLKKSSQSKNLYKKRLNLLTIVLDTLLDNEQKTKVFNLLKRIENSENCKYQKMFTSNGYVFLTVPTPTVLTERELDKLLSEIDKE